MTEELKKGALQRNVGDMVIERLNALAEANFTFPKDYNYVNAIKMSVLKLQELKDKNGKTALEVCTPESVQSALFKMSTKGLNLAYNQAYAIVRGNVLCIDPSYFGNVLMVKRIFPDWEPMPHSIREGDEYVTEVDPVTSKKKLVKHIQKLENLDNDFIGGYILLPSKDGVPYLYEMTKKQILTAWSKSSSVNQGVHKTFSEKMVGKTLVNSGCTMIINSTPELQAFEDVDNEVEGQLTQIESKIGEVVDFEEVKDEPIVSEKKEAPAPAINAEPAASKTDDEF